MIDIKDKLFQLRHFNFKNDLFRYAVKYEIEKRVAASQEPILETESDEAKEIQVWFKALKLYEEINYPDLKPNK